MMFLWRHIYEEVSFDQYSNCKAQGALGGTDSPLSTVNYHGLQFRHYMNL